MMMHLYQKFRFGVHGDPIYLVAFANLDDVVLTPGSNDLAVMV